MRTRRKWWIALSVLVFVLGIGALLWIGQQSRAPRLPEVGLRRESLGQFPQQPGTQHVAMAFPADLNSDGETEAVAVFERLASQRGEPSVWSDLKGRFEPLPAPVLPPPRRDFLTSLPLADQTAPSKPTLVPRELLGWYEPTQKIVRIHRRNGRFTSEPVSSLRFERFPMIAWLDSDEDGWLETLRAQWFPSQLAFRMSREKRWNVLPETPPDPNQVVNRLHGLVSKRNVLPNGQTQVVTPAEFHYQLPCPTVLLPDGDGDGKPEQLDVLKRIVRFSKGRTTPFPRPFKAGEQIIVAELDGVAPAEILYASRADDPAKFGFQIWVYRWLEGNLQLIATHKLLQKPYIALTVKDLDGDGRDEIVGNHTASRNKTRWIVWRFDNGAFQERAAEHPVNLIRLGDAHWLTAGRDTLLGQTTHELSESALRLSPVARSEQGSASSFDLTSLSTITSATILVGLPEGEYRADPKHWKTLAVDGRVLWYGDYDGDGVEEYALSNFTDGGAIAQFREGKWRLTPLKYSAPLVAAFPAQRNGTPQLILVYRDGKIEAIQLAR